MSCFTKKTKNILNRISSLTYIKQKLPAEIEHKPILIDSLQFTSSNINNNGSTNKEIMKAIKASLDIGIELLKITYVLPESNNKISYFTK